ncbi:ABC transporter ATP-binding protein [Leifsonia shinshuensis]|uniref:Oligopeptide/dipeptide ABC transporter ATP-binding protein n=1 Tax=Leifsonia shinshuensis TaxID=150026 RepID=A0A853CYV2_9MICO|nr:ABC transporter ATP-binding protein [Leifsonia shinshuensis]NYJ25767.1 oligopeptide/dipeptide ABC transporter ATP-binding protein [Leifsonia shinshuensis]
MGTRMSEPVLVVQDLAVDLTIRGEAFSPVDRVSFSVARGETLGIVGESGSGKSLTLRAVLGVLPANGTARGRVELIGRPGAKRGSARRIAMVFQEPMLALNPTMRVGEFIAEAVRTHTGVSLRAARARAVELMSDVGIPRAAEHARAWPHELSGGLRQRVMIAAALGTDPDVLLCDEPTTALDVTIQAQILRLLTRVSAERGMAMVFVSHDLAVIGEISQRIAVMYAGRIVETGATAEVLRHPQHPYTAGLLSCTPSAVEAGEPLETIPGSPPDPRAFPVGCRFAPRCRFAAPECAHAPYELAAAPGGATACIRAEVVEEISA